MHDMAALQASELEAHRMRVDYLQRQLYKKKQAAAAPVSAAACGSSPSFFA